MELEINFKKVGNYSPEELKQFREMFAMDLERYRTEKRRFMIPLTAAIVVGLVAFFGDSFKKQVLRALNWRGGCVSFSAWQKKKLAAAKVGPSAEAAVAAVPSAISIEAVKRILPWLVAVAFFMQALDTTILNTAVPAIAKALGVAPLSMKAVLSSYTLSLAVFIPISGWMADRFGTRRVFAWAIGTFTLGSLLCGISNSIHLLVACRVLQGFGGAMMVPVGRLTLVRTFPKIRTHPRDELRGDSRFDRPDARSGRRRIHRRLFSLAADFFHQPAGRPAGTLFGLSPSARLPAGKFAAARSRGIDFVRPRDRAAGVCAGSFWRTYLGRRHAAGVAGRVRRFVSSLMECGRGASNFLCCG
jgi:hypothetical protein